MSVLNINLLRQEQRRVSGVARANFVVMVATGTVVVSLLLITVFLYTTIAIRIGQRQGLIKQSADYTQRIATLDKQKSVFYPDLTLTQQAEAYQQQLTAAGKLIENHKYFTLYLSEIADNTPPTVIYTSFTSDSVDRLTVAGTADSYEVVAKLVESFNKLSFVKGVTLQDAKLDQTKIGKGQSVKFTMVLVLKSAGELKKLPAPNAPTPAPSASLKPSPAPSNAPLTTP